MDSSNKRYQDLSAMMFDSDIFGCQNDRLLSHGLCWFETKEKAHQAIEKFEIATGTKFIKLSHDIYDRSKSRIWWRMNANMSNSSSMEDIFDGVPYVIIGTTKLECQYGKDRDWNRKIKRKQQSTQQKFMDGVHKRKYNQVKGSKKKNCEAFIKIREVARFPQFKISSNTKAKRENASKKLRSELQMNSSSLEVEIRCYVEFPPMSSHSGHDSVEVEGFILTDENLPGSEAVIMMEDEDSAQPQIIQIITEDEPAVSLVEVATSSYPQLHESDFEHDFLPTDPCSRDFDTPPDAKSVARVCGLADDIKVAIASVRCQETLDLVEEDLLRICDFLSSESS